MNNAMEQNMDAACYIEQTESNLQLTRCTDTEMVFVTPFQVDSEQWTNQLMRINKALKHYCEVQPTLVLQYVESKPMDATIQ